MKISNFFHALNTSAAGLKAQRKKLDVISENLANANTTRTPEGGPYQRKIVTTKSVIVPSFSQFLKESRLKLRVTAPGHAASGQSRKVLSNSAEMVLPEIKADQSPFRKVYDPSHPDADENGYVLLPNVNPLTEMIDMINASRSYEANITMVESFKDMAKQALDI